jgi:hypothetical protein
MRVCQGRREDARRAALFKRAHCQKVQRRFGDWLFQAGLAHAGNNVVRPVPRRIGASIGGARFCLS